MDGEAHVHGRGAVPHPVPQQRSGKQSKGKRCLKNIKWFRRQRECFCIVVRISACARCMLKIFFLSLFNDGFVKQFLNYCSLFKNRVFCLFSFFFRKKQFPSFENPPNPTKELTYITPSGKRFFSLSLSHFIIIHRPHLNAALLGSTSKPVQLRSFSKNLVLLRYSPSQAPASTKKPSLLWPRYASMMAL